jgi:hypothetical protein
VVESSHVFPVQAIRLPQQKAYAQNDEAFHILGRKQGSSNVFLYKDLEIEIYSYRRKIIMYEGKCTKPLYATLCTDIILFGVAFKRNPDFNYSRFRITFP